MPVIFAFLIFSSSPYEVVYCTPENTIAPIAKSAPNEIIPLAISATKTCIFSLPALLGSIPTFSPSCAQPCKNATALHWKSEIQPAYHVVKVQNPIESVESAITNSHNDKIRS